MPSDPSRLIAALARDRINLDLKTLDLCFLAGLYLRADRASLASFEEDVLIDMFEQVYDINRMGSAQGRGVSRQSGADARPLRLDRGVGQVQRSGVFNRR
jgi:chromosome partition protein MukF